MTQTSPDTIPPLNAPQTAEAEAVFGPARFTARASATPAGYLALGLAISGVLLGVAAVVWAARGWGENPELLRRGFRKPPKRLTVANRGFRESRQPSTEQTILKALDISRR